MSSRMERYKPNSGKRSERNADLYKTIYEDTQYSNIEGIAKIDNANEIDLSKVNELINNRENYQKQRKYRSLMGDEEKTEDKKAEKTIEKRDYDIRDILSKAREEYTPDNKERVLKPSNYDVYESLNLKPKEEKEEDLEQLNNEDLAASLFSDLTSAGDTMVKDVDDITKSIKEENEKTQNIDDSFFTESLKLNKSDFGIEKKSSILFPIIITLLLILIAACIGYILYKGQLPFDIPYFNK